MNAKKNEVHNFEFTEYWKGEKTACQNIDVLTEYTNRVKIEMLVPVFFGSINQWENT